MTKQQFPTEVREAWGFWDGRADVEMGRPLKPYYYGKHFDEAYGRGYRRGVDAARMERAA